MTEQYDCVDIEDVKEMAEAAKLPATQQPAEITPMQMLQMAVQEGAELDKLEKLMELQERWEATQARKAYTVALAEFKTDPPSIVKDKGVDFGTGNQRADWKYADLAQVAAAVGASLSGYGLSHSWEVAQSDEGNRIAVTCRLTHVMGHSEAVTLKGPPDTSGSKNAIQAIGSTISYLERYSLLAITGLAAGDMDSDGFTETEKVSDEQRADLEKLGDEIGVDWIAFYGWLEITNLADLPADQFTKALQALEKKKAKK